MQIVTSIEQFDDLKNMLVEKVFVRLKVRQFLVMNTKRRRNTSYSHVWRGSHKRKGMMWLTLLFQVRGDVVAITRKTKIVGVVVDMDVDVVAKSAVTMAHKPTIISTLRRTIV